ncbi:carbohydrate esterase family 16 protein [Athelia psychrophila]|uniref:Carbohydrate esterase family 16 protein n=1 Tax=Athelia psychrophila TaxID=1759441 RepID=A0A165YV17_9AGAM|nr:carbohydrate esterase family 16 protein [Fibularhizoctonia sp. CBS 109695]
MSPYISSEGTESGVISVASEWRGFGSIKNLVIFGASYCDIGYSKNSRPNKDHPMGVEFPGTTYAEPGTPNWVGHLISPPLNKGAKRLVYGNAVGGARADGVKGQVLNRFLPNAGKKPKWAPWSAHDTLFCTWVGINDCAYGGDFNDNMLLIFEAQQELYDAGARIFMFVDVPPMERCPGSAKKLKQHNKDAHQSSLIPKFWNTLLAKNVHSFASSHQDVTALIFSSHATFTRVLNDPTAHGFQEEDVDKEAGSIWVDALHPTTKMHEVIASDISAFLESVPSAGGSASAESKKANTAFSFMRHLCI